MKLKRRELILLVVLIVLGCVVAYNQFVYIPFRAETERLRDEVSQNSAKLAELNSKKDSEAEYLNSIKAMEEEIRDVEAKFAHSRDIPETLIELYYLILENNLESSSVTFTSLNKSEKYDYYNMNFEVKGFKKDIDEFMRTIESYDRQVSIDSVEFSSIDENNLTTRISIKIYVLKDVQPSDELYRYDFMEGSYGTFSNWYEMFKSFDK